MSSRCACRQPGMMVKSRTGLCPFCGREFAGSAMDVEIDALASDLAEAWQVEEGAYDGGVPVVVAVARVLVARGWTRG